MLQALGKRPQVKNLSKAQGPLADARLKMLRESKAEDADARLKMLKMLKMRGTAGPTLNELRHRKNEIMWKKKQLDALGSDVVKKQVMSLQKYVKDEYKTLFPYLTKTYE